MRIRVPWSKTSEFQAVDIVPSLARPGQVVIVSIGKEPQITHDFGGPWDDGVIAGPFADVEKARACIGRLFGPTLDPETVCDLCGETVGPDDDGQRTDVTTLCNGCMTRNTLLNAAK